MKKEVIAVSINKEFKQFLMKSEVRLLLNIMADFPLDIVSIQMTKISLKEYNIVFGK